MRAAAIGIGSNSLRMLVADVNDGQLNAILREREGLRVFASLNQQLEISPEMIRDACRSVDKLKQIALEQGAQKVSLFATSAVRDAKNQRAFSQAMLKHTGLTLEICSGEQEAKLSFIGATGNVWSGMIDIGGGSTELVIGQRETIAFAVSLQAGAVRLFRETPIRSAADTWRVKDCVKVLLQPYLLQITQLKTPTEWVGVGGTMTAAATCIQLIDWKRHGCVEGFHVTQSELRHVTETLAEMPLEKRRSFGTIPPDRADIIVHGFTILLGCMETLRIPQIKISERTNLDGYLKLLTADG